MQYIALIEQQPSKNGELNAQATVIVTSCESRLDDALAKTISSGEIAIPTRQALVVLLRRRAAENATCVHPTEVLEGLGGVADPHRPEELSIAAQLVVRDALESRDPSLVHIWADALTRDGRLDEALWIIANAAATLHGTTLDEVLARRSVTTHQLLAIQVILGNLETHSPDMLEAQRAHLRTARAPEVRSLSVPDTQATE